MMFVPETGAPTDVDSLRLMLQDLLATRFKVELHREKKRTSVYELVVAKDGPMLPSGQDGFAPAFVPERDISTSVGRRLCFQQCVDD